MGRNFRENVQMNADGTPEYYDYRFGMTGKKNSDGSFDPNASVGLPDGQTWVLLDGERDSIPCDNLAVNPSSPGLDVKTAISRFTRRRAILDVFQRAGGSISATDLRIGAVPVPLIFDADKIAIGKVEPSSERGGLWILVRAFQHDGGSFLSGDRQYYELDTEVSGLSASASVMVIVGVDSATNEIDVTVGTEHSLIYGYTAEDADAISTAAGIIRLAALVLKDGQTLAADCFGQNPPRYFDCRQFLNLAGGDVEDFTDLGDVPASYSGQAGKVVAVKGDESGLEFISSAAGDIGAKLRVVGTVLHDETLGSDGAFDVSSISQDYDWLQVRAWLRGNVSATSDQAYIFFNNDTTLTNYRSSIIFVGSPSVTNADNPTLAAPPANTAASGDFGFVDVIIPQYAGADVKGYRALSHGRYTSTGMQLNHAVGNWESTSAINRIQVRTDNHATDLWLTGSRLQIIGWREESIGGLDTSDANVSNPPTDAELDSAFGTPAAVGDGFAAIVDDNGADTALWFVASNGTSWYYAAMTKAT